MITASFLSGRLASARRASSCSPAGVAASCTAISLRRKNLMRRKIHGPAKARMGGAATAIARTTASQLAVVSRLWPAPAKSAAASLAARSGAPTLSPTNGILWALSPAEFRLSEMPSAPFFT
ncbi:Uncharacterised protein [Mycobacteroides abscessus subsp. abscessus]|nr:Uncharacterised protein [Mycobacteroides abscessus subsp. abscessus]